MSKMYECKMRRGVSPVVSVSIITAFILVSVLAVFMWAMPILEKSEKIAELERTKAMFSTIDDYVRVVAHSGVNSTRYISTTISKGKMTISNESITYEIDIGEELIKSGTTIKERSVWLTGFGTKIILKLNYSNIELDANDVIMGDKEIEIRKKGTKNNKPLVEVKTI